MDGEEVVQSALDSEEEEVERQMEVELKELRRMNTALSASPPIPGSTASSYAVSPISRGSGVVDSKGRASPLASPDSKVRASGDAKRELWGEEKAPEREEERPARTATQIRRRRRTVGLECLIKVYVFWNAIKVIALCAVLCHFAVQREDLVSSHYDLITCQGCFNASRANIPDQLDLRFEFSKCKSVFDLPIEPNLAHKDGAGDSASYADSYSDWAIVITVLLGTLWVLMLYLILNVFEWLGTRIRLHMIAVWNVMSAFALLVVIGIVWDMFLQKYDVDGTTYECYIRETPLWLSVMFYVGFVLFAGTTGLQCLSDGGSRLEYFSSISCCFVLMTLMLCLTAKVGIPLAKPTSSGVGDGDLNGIYFAVATWQIAFEVPWLLILGKLLLDIQVLSLPQLIRELTRAPGAIVPRDELPY